MCRITEIRRQETNNKVDADETDTNGYAGLKGLAKPLSKAHADDRDNDREHNRGTKPQNKLYDFQDHNFFLHSLERISPFLT